MGKLLDRGRIVVAGLGLTFLFQNCGEFQSVRVQGQDRMTLPSLVFNASSPASHSINIVNRSSIPEARVSELVYKAIVDLGFSDESGPTAGDTFFVGQYYLAWLDNTGFYGKMNGLWPLNGKTDSQADFVLKETNGRAVNFFVPGEDGTGQYAYGYSGADHVEVVGYTADPLDPNDKGCQLCDGYNHQEAFRYPQLPSGWWGVCNSVRPSYQTYFGPIASSNQGSAWAVTHEGPLVSGADTDAVHDGDSCGKDFLFSDQVRRRVYLQSEYRLFADKPYLDRVYRIRNPSGNPAFGDNILGVVGGFVLTKYPQTHPYKDFRFIKIKGAPTAWPYFIQANFALEVDKWNHYSHQPPPGEGDDFVAGLNGDLFLSVGPYLKYGRSLKVSHIGPSNNEDVGLNFGNVLRGLELAGGLLGGKDIYPVHGGTSTDPGIRRLELSGAKPTILKHVYLANQMQGQTGRLEASGTRHASVGVEARNQYLVYGPYATNWGDTSGRSRFDILVDNNTAGTDGIVTIEVYDATAGEVLSSRMIHRNEFREPMKFQAFYLDFGLVGRRGHAMEVRVLWHGTSHVQVKEITSYLNITTETFDGGPVVGASIVYNGNSQFLGHQVGRSEGTSWAVNVVQDRSGFMSFGPYSSDWGRGSVEVKFHLAVDNTKADNAPIATIDIFDATEQRVLATRVLHRSDFSAPLVDKEFKLSAHLGSRAGHLMEARILWHGHSYVRHTKTVVTK